MAVKSAYQLIESTVLIGGVSADGVKNIEWNNDQEKTNNYAASKKPYSRSRKAASFEGSMTMFFRQKIELIKAAGVHSLNDIAPSDVIFMARTAESELVKITLKDVEFTSDGGKFESNADDSEMDHSFLYSDIIIES
jgi:hypothetical protein